MELEPNACAGQVVAAQRLRNPKGLAKPDRIGRRLLAWGNRLPSAFVQMHRFAVRQIARVHLPCAGGQFTQAGEPVNYGARCRRQIGTGLGTEPLLARGRPNHEQHSRSKQQDKECTAMLL